MNIPLPKTLYDVGPGGRFITSQGGSNALSNNRAIRKYNEYKAEYAPETLLAQAASQAAYANNIAPQYMAKMLQDMGIKGSLTDEQLNTILQRVYGAGTNGSPIMNTLQQRLLQRYQHVGEQPQNPFAWLWHKFTGQLSPNQQGGNAVANLGGQQTMPQQGGSVFNHPSPVPQAQPVSQSQTSQPARGSLVDENGTVIDENGDSRTPVTPEEASGLEALNNGGIKANKPIEMTVDTGQRTPVPVPSYGQNEAAYRRQQRQGETLGSESGKMQGEVAQRLDTLAATGGSIDRLIDEFTNPELINLRNEFPYLQDMQIEAASHLNDPRIQNMIGQIKADIEQFKGATVMGFGGQTLKREFDYADKLKPSLNDTVYTATGKLQTLKALHDIAEKKARLIDQFLKDKNTTPAEAVSKANKMVDASAIDKRVRELTAPTVEIENPITHQSMFITTKRAKELGITREQAKKYGMKYD